MSIHRSVSPKVWRCSIFLPSNDTKTTQAIKNITQSDTKQHEERRERDLVRCYISKLRLLPPIPYIVFMTSQKHHHHNDRGAKVQVLYCTKRNAKKLKGALDNHNFLNKDFRMTGVDLVSCSGFKGERESFLEIVSWAETDSGTITIDQDSVRQQCIALPVIDEFLVSTSLSSSSSEETKKGQQAWMEMVVAHGVQFCPYSTAMLGNNRHMVVSEASRTKKCASLEKSDSKRNGSSQMTRVQLGLLSTLTAILSHSSSSSEDDETTSSTSVHQTQILWMMKSIQDLDIATCPKKLEMIGDDHTLVIPRKAFLLTDSHLASLLHRVVDMAKEEEDTNPPILYDDQKFYQELWNQLARIYASPRVVRRGDISPESRVRESGHRLLWPPSAACSDDTKSIEDSNGIPPETGAGSPGWITVTEQGIQQSFDLTRVMFSRGNITEKIRFGHKVVQEGEIVLDMYAGIGYYTLPALVHGKAKHVVACEWNEHAALALRYNLKANGVDDKATVLEGDCRVVAREHNLINFCDRVSLGLLPSCEGGWATAVQALRDVSGGWLHVHANVPDREIDVWQFWLCTSLLSLVQQNPSRPRWVVVCTHLERVKSFAPMIHHYVADVYVGPFDLRPNQVDMKSGQAGILCHGTDFRPCPQTIEPPSCALSLDGRLHQKWMMNESGDLK